MEWAQKKKKSLASSTCWSLYFIYVVIQLPGFMSSLNFAFSSSFSAEPDLPLPRPPFLFRLFLSS